MATTTMTTRCCIAGGGPAGIMLGYLMARAGVDVVILEKHEDFFRDFRGDTVHPSTLDVMYELGILDEFLRVPHQEVRDLGAQIGKDWIKFVDLRHVPTHCKFLAFMPQWDFLNFLSAQGRKFPAFHLEMRTEAVDLIRDGERITGVRATTPSGELGVYADLVVAADGRHSTLRDRSGLPLRTFGAPMDVLWFRLPREEADPGQAFGRVDAGVLMVMIDRGDYYQCGYIIPKGSYDAVKARGIEAFRAEVAALAPFLRSRVDTVRDWNDVSLLEVAVNRLDRWHLPGFLCIGDAAHAMSPVGGVGINLAIQDAVATANICAEPLRDRQFDESNLEAVQRRRMPPTRFTQALQVQVQDRVLIPVLRDRRQLSAPLVMRLFDRVELLRRIPAYVVGVGFRPEHVRSPASPVAGG
ncbi:MAG: FAD-dependent oxidoreductase [Candidatus Eremiobacteraeota bacterium]|nr:FAD-dependent oxidoreductase [Candidatus Eremiobacteraeota bacterium]